VSFVVVEGDVTLRKSDGTEVGTGTDPLRVDPTGTTTQPVSASSLPLPAGAATEATLAAIKDTDGIKKITDPLPTGTNVIGGTTNAVGSQADGHSASIGSTADADTALTVIGRLKQLLTRLPTALVGGRLDSNIGAWLGSTAPTVGQKTMANSVPTTLASDQPAVPVTQQASEEATFTATSLVTAIGTNKSMLSIYNPTASTKILKLREVYIRNAQTTAVTGVVAQFQLLRWAHTTAPTAGTAITPALHDTNDTLGAGIDVRTGGTLGGTEETVPLDIMRISSDEWGTGTADVESQQQSIANYLPARAKRDAVLKPFTIRPGQGIHLKQITASTAGSFDVIFVFTQANI
jgi:hypothetical protein